MERRLYESEDSNSLSATLTTTLKKMKTILKVITYYHHWHVTGQVGIK